MATRQGVEWSRLDNAAKIFPSTAYKTSTNVFRFACELYQPVCGEILSAAVLKASEEFPNFLCVMRKGLFWHYLERCDLKPVVTEESMPPCSCIYKSDERKLLFNVTYFRNRINLEMYHVLGDGTGAMQFLKLIIYHYLLLKHKDEFTDVKPTLDYDASITQKGADSFQKYYKKNKKKEKPAASGAYRLKGAERDDCRLQVIEAVMPVKDVLDAAHTYHTSMTIYLTALFIRAIHGEMILRNEKNPVVIQIPVNLRPYFNSETSKNFFGMISVSYNFKDKPDTLEEIISAVSETFNKELTKERLSFRMNSLAALEHNPFVKALPLPLKNFGLRMARKVSDMGVTAVISNVGKVDMPQEFSRFIRLFDVFSATPKLQLCLCSFKDTLTLSFSSAFVSTEIQRGFIRELTLKGIKTEIRTNDFNNEGED